MSVDVDSFLAEVEGRTGETKSPTKSRLSPEFVFETNPEHQKDFAEYEKRVDALWGTTPSYRAYKNEKPQHRMMLWLRLEGYNNKEIAGITGYTPQTVANVCKQPWFLEAFSRISTEMGKDAVENFLTGEMVPTLQKLVSLRDSAQSEAVQLAASNAILDRIRGKPTVRVETKNETNVTLAVADINELEAKYQQNQQTLESLGIRGNN